MASILDRFRNLITKNATQTAAEYNKAIYNQLGHSVLWNTENDDNYITEGYRRNATIYSLINIITKAATTIPFMVYEKTKDSEYKRYKAMQSGVADPTALYKSQLIKKNALIQLEGHELQQLLENPNAAQSYSSWISELIAFRKLTGNGYIYGISPETGANAGKFTELYVMPSQVMEIISNGMLEPVSKYRLEYNGTYDMPADAICHIKDFNPYYDGTGSHLYGQSPLRAGFRSLTTNNEAVTTGVKYLQNQTARGILMSEEGDINEVQAQQLKDKFRRQHQGSTNAGDILITPKKLSWVNFGLNASDLSLIEQYNASVKDLCNIYGVPVQMLNNTDASTYNNMKEAKKALYQMAVIPELMKIQDELNRWLAPKYGDKICIEYDFTSIPEMQEETEKVVDQLSKAWWITPNEKRDVMNYGIDEENEQMNSYFVPANLVPMDNDLDLIDEPIAPQPQPVQDDVEDQAEEKMLKAESYSNYPQGATNNAKRMLEWREKYGRDVVQGGTPVGWTRANQLANREALSLDTVKRINSFLARHEDNAVIADEYKDEPWKDKGYVAYNLWGGKAMVSWAKRIAENG
jgi:HK97 family phage portal protein